MKKNYISLFIVLLLTTAASFSQTISTFEGIVAAPDSFWDGRYNLSAGGFNSGNAFFNNGYDTTYDFWSEGFMVSNKTDSSTSAAVSPFSKLTTAVTGNGYFSNSYAIGTQYATVKLTGAAAGKSVHGFYVTNSNYTYLSMMHGDMFAKKFGGSSGNDTDYLRLTVYGYHNGGPAADTVNFYLADYRFPTNSQDYILKNWAWVDLTSLGNVDSLRFMMSSTDNDSIYGMNTPAYYCIDGFATANFGTGISKVSEFKKLDVYPNPSQGDLFINLPHNNFPASVMIYSLTGKIVKEQDLTGRQPVNISDLQAGVYFVEVMQEGVVYRSKFIRE